MCMAPRTVSPRAVSSICRCRHDALKRIRIRQAFGLAGRRIDSTVSKLLKSWATRFHADHARFKLREIPEYFCASQLLAHKKATLRIHSVKLQPILGQIQSNSCYLHDERSFAVGITTCPLWHESLAV